ncbi:MAG: hypothetical protein DRI65_06135, partial [Chloroflexota bacterium]
MRTRVNMAAILGSKTLFKEMMDDFEASVIAVGMDRTHVVKGDKMPLSQEMAEEFERRREESKKKRAQNRDSSRMLLESKGISHEVK